MKKMYIICLFIAVLLGAVAYVRSYNYFLQAGAEHVSETTETILPQILEVAVKEDTKITQDTKYYVETYDMGTNTVMRTEEELPENWIGNSRKELADQIEVMMENSSSEEKNAGLLSIELKKFYEDEITIRKTYKQPDEIYNYFLDVQMGRVIVRNVDQTLYAYTEVKFNSLPEELKRKILNGYEIQNLEELYEFLEAYSS